MAKSHEETARRRARKPAQQARSRRTERAILKAVRSLLRQRPFDQVQMTDVARLAEVSVGGLYGRFPGGKSGLLQFLYARLLEEWIQTLEEALPDGREGALSLEDVVARYVTAMVEAFDADRPLLVAARQAFRSGELDPKIAREAAAFDRQAHERFYRFAGAALPESVRDDAGPVLRFALLQLSAAGRAAVGDRSVRVYDLPESTEYIAGEITRSATAYIRDRLNLG